MTEVSTKNDCILFNRNRHWCLYTNCDTSHIIQIIFLTLDECSLTLSAIVERKSVENPWLNYNLHPLGTESCALYHRTVSFDFLHWLWLSHWNITTQSIVLNVFWLLTHNIIYWHINVQGVILMNHIKMFSWLLKNNVFFFADIYNFTDCFNESCLNVFPSYQ